MSLFGGKTKSAKSPKDQKVPLLGYQVQSSCQGVVVPIVYGQQRIPGNLIWAANFQAIPLYTSTSSGMAGGKGGGAAGGGSTVTVTYTYQMDIMIGLCQGPILGVLTIYDGSDILSPSPFDQIALGGRPSSVWGYLATYYAAQALAYSGLAVACKAGLDLGASAQIPNYNFEVQGFCQFGNGIVDALPSDILYDFLTNPNYGCGWNPALVGDLTQFRNYCIANGIFLSPPMTTQQTAASFLDYLMQLSNCEIVWSGGQLKVVPYGDTAVTGPAAVLVTSYGYVPAGGTITVPNWVADDEVFVMQQSPQGGAWENYQELTAGGAPPGPGDYSVAAGVYTFNGAQVGQYVGITYWQTPSGIQPVTFTPNLTPIYALGPDDFLSDSKQKQAPVVAARTAISDAYNWFQLEWFNRASNYDTTIADVKDLNAIDLYGPRLQSSVEAHAIPNSVLAQFIGQTMLQKALYIRNTYTFKLDGRYFLLDPMDWVSLTMPNMGMTGVMCRIISIEEADDGTYTFQVEEWPEACGTPAIHTLQPAGGLQLNANVAPGNIKPPIIFEAPALLTQAGYEVWVAACGGANWGGAEVWTSYDGTTYKRVGLIINPARMGVLAQQLASGNDPDTVNSVYVDLTESGGILAGGTQQDADLMATALYVGGEIISYELATLTALSKYTLGTYLRRGAYLTAITAHAQNTPVCRLDQAIFKIPYQPSQVGLTLYIKFLSFNLWHGATQGLADVSPYTFFLSGSGISAGLPAITNLASFYQSGQMFLVWDKPTDPLASYRLIDFEGRKGTAWGTAEIVGRTSIPTLPCFGNGTYWVASHYEGFYGAPTSILVTNSSIIGTVLASYDDYAAGWPGAISGGVFKDGAGDLEITGAGPGYYASNSQANLGSCKLVTVAANYLFASIFPGTDVDSWPDWDSVPDVDGQCAGQTDVKVQVQVSQDGTNFGNWQDLHPGQYYAWKINLRLLFTVYEAGASPVVSQFNWTVGQ